jgi:oxygen-independent coproporphyrinogen-3 oxidase
MDFVLELLKKYEENGWALCKDERWRFTPAGFLLSNVLIGELLDAQTRQRTQISKPWQKEAIGEEAQMTLFDKRPVAAGLFGGRRLIGSNEFL